MKQAYTPKWAWDGFTGYYNWHPVRLTGLCKTVTGGLNAGEQKFFQARHTLFNIPLWAYWIRAEDVRFADPIKVVIYDCDCDN